MIATTTTLRFTVNYRQSLTQMLEAANFHGDGSRKIITPENFRIQGPKRMVKFEGYLLEPKPFLYHSEVRRLLESEKWVPAKVEHLLSFAVAFPEAQIWRSIVGPDASYLSGSWTYFLTLMHEGSKRVTGGYSVLTCFNTDFQFLGVRELKG